MNFLRRFMYGRYGMDQLSTALIFGALLFMILSSLFGSQILNTISLALLVYSYFRILSRNTTKRYAENTKFLQLVNPLQKWFKQKKARIKGMKTHRYFKCPSCKQDLRVPKGKGKITITCPKCKTEFSAKS